MVLSILAKHFYFGVLCPKDNVSEVQIRNEQFDLKKVISVYLLK